MILELRIELLMPCPRCETSKINRALRGRLCPSPHDLHHLQQAAASKTNLAGHLCSDEGIFTPVQIYRPVADLPATTTTNPSINHINLFPSGFQQKGDGEGGQQLIASKSLAQASNERLLVAVGA